MCADPDKATTEEFRKRVGRQRAYKVIYRRTARPSMFTNTGVPYHPGRNVDHRAVKTYLGYKRGFTRGFHCYIDRQAAIKHRRFCYNTRSLTVVCVTFDPCDVIAAEPLRYGKRNYDRNRRQQVVVRALNISNRAWKQAGLPATKGGAS